VIFEKARPPEPGWAGPRAVDIIQTVTTITPWEVWIKNTTRSEYLLVAEHLLTTGGISRGCV
jgi:hypothetical protein